MHDRPAPRPPASAAYRAACQGPGPDGRDVRSHLRWAPWPRDDLLSSHAAPDRWSTSGNIDHQHHAELREGRGRTLAEPPVWTVAAVLARTSWSRPIGRSVSRTGLGVFVCLVSPAGSCWSNGTRSWGVESLRARQVSGYFRAWSGRCCCQVCCHRPPHPAPARTAELSRSYVLRSRRVGRRDCVIIGA